MATEPSKKFRRINLDLVLSSTSLTRNSKETADTYLARVTHLHLQRKKIRFIENLELCTNLKVLYLYDNLIENIENLNFAGILQYLYMHNNFIKQLPVLTMPSLKKLYLDDNEIQEVSGLQECPRLEELHVARQRLPTFTTLKFEDASLRNLSRSMQVLEISGNNISILAPFMVLYNLRKLICMDNTVIDLGEVEGIVSLPRIEEANFIGNPCCALKRYRDTAIGASSDTFIMLDDLPIPKHQQIAIRGLMDHRRKIGEMSRFNHMNSGQSGQSDDEEE